VSLLGLVDRVTARMRAAGVVGRTVVVRFRFDDLSRATRSHTLPMATAETRHVVDAARGLLLAERPLIDRAGLTLVGVSVTNLDNARAVQLPLPFEARSRADLDHALDAIHDRFGKSSVTRGSLLGRDPGWTAPQLPD
jgi:DNA polymerase-4